MKTLLISVTAILIIVLLAFFLLQSSQTISYQDPKSVLSPADLVKKESNLIPPADLVDNKLNNLGADVNKGLIKKSPADLVGNDLNAVSPADLVDQNII